MKLLDKDGNYPVFNGPNRIVIPTFNAMWKEWISVIPGIPQNKNSRDRARKLFEKVYDEWWKIMVPEIQRGATLAYREGYDEGAEMGKVKEFNSGPPF
jgi:hypothetical protein